METIIRPTLGWHPIDLRSLWRYKDLLYFLTVRGIKARYAQSVLGVGWAIIQPLFTTLVFTVVFGNLAGISSDGVPYVIFSFTAMVPWNYFSSTLTESSNSLVQNANMITKVYFPRLVLPLSAALSKLLDFIIGLAELAGFMIWFRFVPRIYIHVVHLLILILLITCLGVGVSLRPMLDDARLVVERADAAGGEATLHVFDELWHVFQASSGMIPEADESLREIGAFCRAQLARRS